jgi:predicted secreted protein
MTIEDLERLNRGAIVRHRLSGNTYVVDHKEEGGRVAVAVRTVTVTNPDEWSVVHFGMDEPGEVKPPRRRTP